MTIETNPGTKVTKNGPYINNNSNIDQMKMVPQNGDQPASKEEPERGQWGRGFEFLLSCVSLSVGLGNVWRFPYVAYTNGGGAFLIPYLILLFFIGRPLYYMELVLGQFSGCGPIKVWRVVPAFKGIGFAQMTSCSYVTVFYNYLMALTLYYFFASFASPLPWTVCDPSTHWSASLCSNSTISQNNSFLLPEKYFNKEVLHLSSGLEEITWFNWRIAGCLLLSWTLVFLSLINGIQSLGKVAYFTAIFPYVVLIALLIASLLVDGAVDGIIYFFKPQWHRLWDPLVWYNAVLQSFFSLGVCAGALLMYSSYNNFRKDVYKDVIIISVLDTFTSILAGCVIFAVLGSMAKSQGVDVSEVAKSDGTGLAFIAYPQALGQFTFWPNLWSISFFVMLFTLGIGSSVAQVETTITCLKDQSKFLMKHKTWTAFGVCFIYFLLGLPLATDGGMYIMKLLEEFGVGISAFLYGILQAIGITWIYGYQRFANDIKFMLGRPVSFFWRLTWSILTPILLGCIFLYGNYMAAVTQNHSDPLRKGIPVWGELLGWTLAGLALIQIPLWMVITICQQSGDMKQKIKNAFSPTRNWGPRDPVHFEEWLKYKSSLKQPKNRICQVNAGFVMDNYSTSDKQV
ncbi:sodium-dependent nutrient amino acid transporter 1 [Tetranychus urticae]|uniref:Transporter n=1 Tax=Tetranychus urticae TaxID=32264 RepID=T1K3G6_TETUR|nr:sodium-dependent nutrient amino acid transporter 1 [Tetranychus urticae]